MNEPKLRFPEFNDTWGTVIVSAVLDTYLGKTPKTSDYANWDGDILWYTGTEVGKGRYLYDSPKKLTERGRGRMRLMPKGTMLVSVYGSLGTFGIATEACTFNQCIIGILPNSDLIVQKYVYALQGVFERYIKKNATGLAQKGLPLGKFNSCEIPLPALDEQKKIGDLFDSLDSKIDSSKNTLEKIRLRKKGLAQKIFSQEIRLPGFEGEWDNAKIDELFSVKLGKTPSTSVADNYDGEINWYAVADLSSAKYLGSSKRTITKKGLGNNSLVPEGTLLISIYGTLGEMGITTVESYFNQAVLALTPKDTRVSVDFTYSLKDYIREEMIKRQTGLAQKGVNKTSFCDISILLPSEAEQQVIGNLFKKLDEQIKAQEELLEAYKLLKKGLGQQMFN